MKPVDGTKKAQASGLSAESATADRSPKGVQGGATPNEPASASTDSSADEKKAPNAPKDYLVKPDDFGRNLRAVWNIPKGQTVTDYDLAAAYYQHVWSCLVNREFIKPPYKGNVSKLAKVLGMARSTCNAKLYGDRRADISDVLRTAQIFGRIVIPDLCRIYPHSRREMYVPDRFRTSEDGERPRSKRVAIRSDLRR
jgi:predicted transcriptional regulator